MTIVDSRPNERVAQKLEFIEPFQSVAEVSFVQVRQPDSTKVTWAMDGKHNFISKAMCVVKPMDKMIGPDFEEGLTGLKRVAEARKAATPPPPPKPRRPTWPRRARRTNRRWPTRRRRFPPGRRSRASSARRRAPATQR